MQPLRQREAGHQRTAEHREYPERRLRPLAAADDPEDRRRQRQQADEHDRMRGGHVLERQRGQQRKADHDTERNDHQRGDVATRGALLLEGQQQAQRQRTGDCRPGHRQENGIELHHGDARGGKRPAEDHHADETVDPPGRCPVHVPILRLPASYLLRRLAQPVTVRYNYAELLCSEVQYG